MNIKNMLIIAKDIEDRMQQQIKLNSLAIDVRSLKKIVNNYQHMSDRDISNAINKFTFLDINMSDRFEDIIYKIKTETRDFEENLKYPID